MIHIIIGGPFSFLAGLFMLGGAAISKVNEMSEDNIRKAEFAKHKYIPWECEYSLINSAYYEYRDFGGFDHMKIIEFLEKEYDMDYYDARKTIACCLSRYVIEEIGYEFKHDSLACPFPRFSYFDYKMITTDEFRVPYYYDVQKCKSKQDLIDLLGNNFMRFYAPISAPYCIIYANIKKGSLPDVTLTSQQLWYPHKGDR